MKFCINCFIDTEIKNIIGKSRNIGICPICNKKDVPLYDSAMDTSIRDIFNPLFDLYTVESDAPIDIPKTAFTTIIEDILENWNIFNPSLKISQVRKILESLCEEKQAIDRNYLPHI